MEADGVLSDWLGRQRLGCRFEHGQGSGSELGRVARFAANLAALVVAQSAWARVTQEWEAVMRAVSVLPINLHTANAADIYPHRLWICCRHSIFSIAQQVW